MQPTTTVAEVKHGIEAAAGPKWMEQVLLLSADDGSKLPLANEDTLGACGVSSVSILVVESIHTAKVTGADGGNRGFSRRTEVMMRRRKVMDAIMRGWTSVTQNTPQIVKARLDPDRTPEAEFLTFVQEQPVLIRHARVQRGLPTVDQILERMIAQHMEEGESEEAVPPEPQPEPPAVVAAEPEPEPEAEPTLVAQTPAVVPAADASVGSVEVVFRVMVKGVQPFSYSFPATATTAAVHAYLVATMAESGMEGFYDLKEGFPPRKLGPSEETLAEAGLAIDSKLTLQCVPAAAPAAASPPVQGASSGNAAPQPTGDLAKGGAIYEAVVRKYVGRTGARLVAGRVYRAPLVRGRYFVYDPATDSLSDAPPAGSAAGSAMSEDADGFDQVWRTMFEATPEGTAQLQPGGRYYKAAAAACGVGATGPLNPSMLYSFPNPMMAMVSGGDDHSLNFSYNPTTDQLVYDHASQAEVAGEGGGGGLDRMSSANTQQEALRSWTLADFLRPENLRPGGMLYMNAVDSFGELTEDKVYLFPHFGPIKGETFRYRAGEDVLVMEGEEQFDFIRGATMHQGGAKRPRSGWGGGGNSLTTVHSGEAWSSRGDSVPLRGMTGGGGQLTGPRTPDSEPEPEPAPTLAMSDEERRRAEREARLKRFG